MYDITLRKICRSSIRFPICSPESLYWYPPHTPILRAENFPASDRKVFVNVPIATLSHLFQRYFSNPHVLRRQERVKGNRASFSVRHNIGSIVTRKSLVKSDALKSLDCCKVM